MRSGLLALISLVGTAYAGPDTLTHQGRLVDALGQPANGTFQLTFTLHTHLTNEAEVWTETDTVSISDGYFSTTLGDGTSLAALDFATQSFWLEVSQVGGVTMSPRTELGAVPAALSLSGGFRPPSVTTTERDALSPLPGQMVYNTDASEVQVFGGGAWTRLGGTTASDGGSTLLTWGRNDRGQLGLDNSTQTPVPTAVPGVPADIVVIDGGQYRDASAGSLRFITSDGRFFGSGYGNHLPDPNRTQVDVFTEYPVSPTLTQLFGAKGGLHTCGIDASGNGYCWGYQSYGALGNGSEHDLSYQMTPDVLVGGRTWKMVKPAGYRDGAGNHDAHTCGITTETGVPNGYCWGLDTAGVLGNGASGSNYSGPTEIARLDAPASGWPNGIEWDSIDAGYYQSCGVDINGDGWCWGDAATGRLGTGSESDQQLPTPISGGHTWDNVQIGEDHGCGLRTDGKILCWGDNPYGQLGTGTTGDSWVPVEVVGGKQWAQLSVGQFTNCAIDTAGAAYCWGYNGNGTVGDATTTDRLVPTPVYGEYRFRDIVVGARSVIALTR